MKKYILQTIIILVLALINSGVYAQDNRTLDTKVADLLAQMPASDLVYRNRLLTDLVELGPEGFQKITNQLTPPGKDDDTAARFAINSLSRYGSEFGKEKIRKFVETNLLNALEKESDKDIKVFLIHQLNLVASAKSVATVKKYLTDEHLSEPVTQLLLSVKGEVAAQALLEVLPNTTAKIQITLVKALGELRCMLAVEEITPLVQTTNPILKK